MLRTILRNSVALSCVIGVSFAVVGPSFAGDNNAANYNFPKYTNDYQIQMDGGFDDSGVLLPDPTPSYMTLSMVKQIDDRCTSDLKAGISGKTAIAWKLAIKMGAFEVIGSIIGLIIGVPNAPASLFREIAGTTGGAAIGGGFAAGTDEEEQVWSAAHSYCVLLRVQKNQRAFVGDEQPLRDVTIVPTLHMKARMPASLPPGIVGPLARASDRMQPRDDSSSIPPPPPL